MNPFRAALDGWTEDRWMKEASHDEDGRACALGRLADQLLPEAGFMSVCYCYTLAADDLDAVAEALFPDRIQRRRSIRVTAIVNDHPDTTFADVEQIFEKAAVRWDERV